MKTMPKDGERGERGKFLAGHKKLPGAGRQPGSPNKTTQSLKEALLKAASAAGDGDMVAYLTKMALEQPSSFLALLGRVLPLQLQSEGRNELIIRRVEYVIIDPKEPRNAKTDPVSEAEIKKLPPPH